MCRRLLLLALQWAIVTTTRIPTARFLQPQPPALPLLDTTHVVSYVSGTEQGCLAEGLSQMAKQCQAQSIGGGGSIGDQVTKLLRACLHTSANASDTQRQPARLLFVESPYLNTIRNITTLYQNITGSLVDVVAPSGLQGAASILKLRQDSIDHPSDINRTHEAWLITPGYTAEGAESGAFADLSDLVLLEHRLQWEDIIKQMRESGLLYKSKVVSMPLSSFALLLYYRQDVFEQYNIAVPRTWRQLISTVKQYNGTAGLHSFCAGWGPCTLIGPGLIRQLYSSVHQTHGPTQGWAIDPDSLLNSSSPRYADMGLLLDSPAAIEVHEILRELYQWSPPDKMTQPQCSVDSSDFMQMKCMMAIDIPSIFKYISHDSKSHPMQGKLGVALLPGSETILDLETNMVVPCDSIRCPYATKFRDVTSNATSLVNQSPGFDAFLLALNAHSASDLGFFTFRVVSYSSGVFGHTALQLTSSNVTDVMVYNPDYRIFPSRYTQLDAERWAAAGYDPSDSQSYCETHLEALSHDNLHVQMRLPVDFVGLFINISNSIINTTRSISSILSDAQQQAKQMLNDHYQGDMQALQADYFASLNRQVLPDTSIMQQTGSGRPTHSLSDAYIAVTTVLALATAAAAFLVWRYRHKLLQRVGHIQHPQAGPLTTLLITDIESSTQLWEALEDGVMNTAMTLHDNCIRSLAAEHDGYESMWEGDSFTIAFHTPQPALEFALALQIKLLQLSWPVALLSHAPACEVWARQGRQQSTAFRTSAMLPPLQPLASALLLTSCSSGDSGPISLRPKSDNSDTLSWKGSLQSPTSQTISADNNLQVTSPPLHRGRRSGSSASRVPAAAAAARPFEESSSVHAQGSTGNVAEVPRHHKSAPLPKLSHRAAAAAQQQQQMSDAASQQPQQHAAATAWQTRRQSGLTEETMQMQRHATAQSLPSCELADAPVQASTSSAASSTWSTYEQQVAGSWVCCDATAPGAQLIFRGLRVRVGLSLGTAIISYNDVMGRYRYSGPIRAMANAVANAAHGGQVMLDSSTAAALTSRLHDALSTYMGGHILSDVAPDPIHLVMVLPNQLRARLSVSSTKLRTSMCYLRGVLQAPVPSSSTRPGLAYLQPLGLGILMAWDAPATLHGLAQLHQALQQQAHRWDGFVFEDGLLRLTQGASGSGSGAASSTASTPTSSTTSLRGPTRSTPNAITGPKVTCSKSLPTGSLAICFPDPLRALKFAVCLRLELLHLDWGELLLCHELCEPLGWDGPEQPSRAASSPEVAAILEAGLAVCDVVRGSWKQPGAEAALELGTARVQVSPISFKSRGVAGTWYALDAPMLRGLRTRTVLLGRVQDMQPNLQTRGFMRATYTTKYSKQLGQLFKLARQGQILADVDVISAAGWAMPVIPE